MFMHTSIHVYITVTIKEFYIKSKCWERKRGGGANVVIHTNIPFVIFHNDLFKPPTMIDAQSFLTSLVNNGSTRSPYLV